MMTTSEKFNCRPEPHNLQQNWDRSPWNRWSFQHVREILPTTRVWRGPGLSPPLPHAIQDIGAVRFDCDGWHGSVSDFFDLNFTDGALILHRGKVVAEHYFNGMEMQSLHLSQSVSKSLVGVLTGILIGRGVIDPDAPLTAFLPELVSTAYRGATIRHVLDMTSGVLFDETYTALDSHMAKLDAASGWKDRLSPIWPSTVWDLILTLTETECEHGTSFRYRSIETDVLAFALERATGLPLADLVSHEIWQPIGAEEDAYFTVDPAGYALADGGFNATLRDYGRFALLLLNGGIANERQIIPAGWLQETRMDGNPEHFGDIYRSILPSGTYRNQFWIEDQERRAFMARGVFGQLIYIDPSSEFAAVLMSSWPEFLSVSRSHMALAALHAIRRALAY